MEIKSEMTNVSSTISRKIRVKKQPILIEEIEPGPCNIYTILTEEDPSNNEVSFLLNEILKIESSLFEDAKIVPNYIDNKFKGE
jgi:hypothetical protein